MSNVAFPESGWAILDGLDIAIIRSLAYGPEVHQWELRSPFARVARELEVDENTVRNRVRKLEEGGLIRGWQTMIHPRLLGAQMAALEVLDMDESRKEAAIDTLRALDGMHLIFDHYRNGLQVVVLYTSEEHLERLTDLVANVCDARVEAWPGRDPPLEAEPDQSDWRLIQALRKAPKQPLAEVADAAGMSVRTVQRRLPRLLDGRALFVALDTDFTRMEGRIPVHVRVVLADEEERDAVVRTLMAGGEVIFAKVSGPLLIVAYLMEAVGEIAQLDSELRTLPGAEDVRVDIQMQRIICDRWLDEAVAAKVAEA